MIHDFDAIYDHGVFRPLEPLLLPEGARVHLHVEAEHQPDQTQNDVAHVRSPRLVHPEQAADFQMDVREVTDAGL